MGFKQNPAPLLSHKGTPKRFSHIHSDRGIQYTSKDFRAVLEEKGFTQSMSRKENCWDNAVAG